MTFLLTDRGVRLRCADCGEGGQTFVLVHGWKGSHRLWDKVIARLATRHRVVAFDLRGMGESDKPNEPCTFDLLAEDLHDVLTSLDLDDVTLVGWSMGCSVVLKYLERPRARVGRLVLSNGPVRLTRTADFPHAITREEYEAHLTAIERDWPASERAFQADGLARPDAAVVDWLYSIALQTPVRTALEVAREQAKLDLRPVLETLDIPVLALYSRGDPYYPTSLARYIARRARHGSLVLIDRGAHYIQVEAPVEFCRELERFAQRRAA